MLLSSVFWSHYLPALPTGPHSAAPSPFGFLTTLLPKQSLLPWPPYKHGLQPWYYVSLVYSVLPPLDATSFLLRVQDSWHTMVDTHAKIGTLLSGSDWGVVGPAPLQAPQSLPSFSIPLCDFTRDWVDGLCSVLINTLTQSNLGKGLIQLTLLGYISSLKRS